MKADLLTSHISYSLPNGAGKISTERQGSDRGYRSTQLHLHVTKRLLTATSLRRFLMALCIHFMLLTMIDCLPSYYYYYLA
ncbi:hypothetical protein I7I48_07281 [Histoplasma ohiense]|nr:hypothetical protein I7I48_07281 [Histoplasma ohiense (nom. inval.)]